jgi:hypothetical protein
MFYKELVFRNRLPFHYTILLVNLDDNRCGGLLTLLAIADLPTRAGGLPLQNVQ